MPDNQPKVKRLLLLYVMIFSIVFFLQSCKEKIQFSEPKHDKIKEPKKAEFVERQLCVDCHITQWKVWLGSHHDLAMDVVTEKTVIGDFNNSTLTQHGVTSTFYKKDKKFFIRTDEKITPKHIFHWTRRFLNWNYMCAECHSTNLQKNYDLATNTFNTTWSEIDVGCQACHGPGSRHVEWAHTRDESENTDYAFEDTGLEVDLKANDHNVQIEACARCHSRRNGLRKDYQYGKPFMDYYVAQVLIDPFCYPDGQILDEVYVYGSFLQS